MCLRCLLLPRPIWSTHHCWGISHYTLKREPENTETASNTLKRWKSTEGNNYHFIRVIRLDWHSPFQQAICLRLKWKGFLRNDAFARGSQLHNQPNLLTSVQTKEIWTSGTFEWIFLKWCFTSGVALPWSQQSIAPLLVSSILFVAWKGQEGG